MKVSKQTLAAVLVLLVFVVNLVLPGFLTEPPVTASALTLQPDATEWSVLSGDGEYWLRLWISDSEFGESPDVYHKGITYYLCYELTYTATGALVNDQYMSAYIAANRPDGSVINEHTFTNSCTGWISLSPDALGEWSGSVYVSGPNISFDGPANVSWKVTAPYVNLRVWVSDDEMGDVCNSFAVGETYYICYELTDLDLNQPLDSRVYGYTADVVMKDPSGETVYSTTHENSTWGWISAPNKHTGKWTGSVAVTGDFKVTVPVSWNVKAGTEAFSDRFRWEQDNWDFNNNSEFYTSGYYIDDARITQFMEDAGLTNIEREMFRAAHRYDEQSEFGGSCFGMTASEILVKQGALDLTRYGGNSVVNQNSNSDAMLELNNFLWQLQDVPRMGQLVRYYSYYSDAQSDILAKLADTMQNEDFLVNLCYNIAYLHPGAAEPTYSGHSVLAYGIEACTYTSDITNRTYDKRILIADPNFSDYNSSTPTAHLYFDSSDYSWIIPYFNKTDDDGTVQTCYWNAASGNTDNGFLKTLIRHISMADGENLMLDAPAEYIGRLVVYNQKQDKAAIEKYSADSRLRFVSLDACMDDSHIDSEGSDNSLRQNWTFWTTAGRKIVYQQPTDFNFYMDWENVGYIADVRNTSSVITTHDAYLELAGENISYDVSIVTNDKDCVTDWYTVTVSGSNADSLTYYMTEEGYVVSSDNLQNITVNAHNTAVSAQTEFSTEYDTVLIYEISATSIGIAADANGDGIFDTDIIGNRYTQSTELLLGDVNGDGKADSADAADILIDAARVGAGDASEFNSYQAIAADVDRDGRADSADAALVLEYAAVVGAGDFSGTLEEYLAA